ncbi:MAG TPA: hypothetical protein PLP33_25360 [Leptospiraceae bacterium]|nr:hypothetical protein [Leptospiraceae bacterium]
MKHYEVNGTIEMCFSTHVYAESKEEAEELAKELAKEGHVAFDNAAEEARIFHVSEKK